MSHYQTDTIFHCYRRLPLMRTCCAAKHIIYGYTKFIYVLTTTITNISFYQTSEIPVLFVICFPSAHCQYLFQKLKNLLEYFELYMYTINTRIITIGMTIVMKCAFYRPSSHVTCALNQNMAALQVHHLVPPNIPTRKFTLKQHTLFHTRKFYL